MVMVDDCHAVGFLGAHGRGSAEHCGVEGRVDIVTGTLGKALGGASGGYTAGPAPVIDWLRQRSRPYLFSNTLAPVIAAASLKVFDLIEHGDALRARLFDNARHFRAADDEARLQARRRGSPDHSGDARRSQRWRSDMADAMLARGVYVIGFSFPVVPKGQARIRTQMSAAHSRAEVDQAIEAFAQTGRELGVI